MSTSEPILTVFSHGMGQDSSAIAAMLAASPDFRQRYAPGKTIAVFSDTGYEKRETYQHVPLQMELLQGVGIPLTHLTPDMGFHSEAWRTLFTQFRRNRTILSRAMPMTAKTCSANLKPQPIWRFVEAVVEREFGPEYKAGRKAGLKRLVRDSGRKIRLILGIAAGEERRVASDEDLPKWFAEVVERVYPLIDLGLDRAGAQQVLRAHGQPVPLPSACATCHFTTPEMLLYVYRTQPEVIEEWAELEDAKLRSNHDKTLQARYVKLLTGLAGKHEVPIPDRATLRRLSPQELTDMYHRLFPGEDARLAEEEVLAQPVKNLGVFGEKTLRETLAELVEEHRGTSLEALRDSALRYGHCLTTSF